MRTRLLPVIGTLVFLATGAIAAAVGARPTARIVWMAGVVVMGAPLVFNTVRGALAGRFAADVVATLSIIGAVALNQPLAGLVIVLMQTGGEALERYAEGRASAAVRALESAAPRIAHRVRGDRVDDIAVSEIAVDDLLLVRPGDVIPCDGVIVEGESELDTSSLTGEARPVPAEPTTRVMSGMINGYGSFTMRATAPAEQSQYARIVELVKTAQASKAPLQRLADRYAVWFTPITVGICAIAVALTHDWMRALAILVVATPCPLILATPVAIIGGINRAAKRFIIIRNGGALETLSEIGVAAFDKTGTLTIGKPRLSEVRVAPGFERERVLRYAAAVEERSSHLLARVLVDVVKASETLPAARDIVETPGKGVQGTVDGHVVAVGGREFAIGKAPDSAATLAQLEQGTATLRAFVTIDGRLAASLEYADEIRPDLVATLNDLRASGVRRFMLLSGDHSPIAREVAGRVGITETHGDLTPADKARFIDELRREGASVLMVGDGINDAPALSSANVSIALAAHGGGIASEAADIIVLVDAFDRVGEVKRIADRTMRIARQSIWVGLGLSGIGMIFAAFGALPPIAGAATQEIIDVAVILNALRTSTSGRGERAPRSGGREVQRM
jgi:heavy metal translocating P-type ATPase